VHKCHEVKQYTLHKKLVLQTLHDKSTKELKKFESFINQDE